MLIARRVSIVFLFACMPVFSSEEINLEQMFSSDIVLETKQIVVPDYPRAFNPSIVKWNGSYLMSFRHIPNPKDSFTCYIGLVWLDDDFNPVGRPQFLNARPASSNVPFRSDDSRLVTVNNRLYIVYSDNEDQKISKGGFRVYIAELVSSGPFFELKKPEKLSIFKDENPNIREKNWVPFEYNGELLLAYSLVPHKILKPYLNGNNSCASFSLTEKAFSDWKWGVPRGSTSALATDDEYLAFFHSSVEMASSHSKNNNAWHYFMGAYTFENKPPFTITRISPDPIVGDDFYSGPEYKPYWKPVKVVFPCGFLFDDRYIWVSYGRDDYESWVAKIDKQKLLESLVPVK